MGASPTGQDPDTPIIVDQVEFLIPLDRGKVGLHGLEVEPAARSGFVGSEVYIHGNELAP